MPNYLHAIDDLYHEMQKYTQRELAEKSGLHINTINRWMNGHLVTARAIDLFCLADALGMEFLLFEKETEK